MTDRPRNFTSPASTPPPPPPPPEPPEPPPPPEPGAEDEEEMALVKELLNEEAKFDPANAPKEAPE